MNELDFGRLNEAGGVPREGRGMALVEALEALKDKRVIVTGGSGVIGRELLKMLSRAGAGVISVDKIPFEGSLPEGVTEMRMDLSSEPLDALANFEPNCIFHLAASFERSKESPEFWSKNWNDNIVPSHRVVDLSRGLPSLESFIFASSYLIYSPRLYMSPGASAVKTVLLSEDSPVEPRNITGAAKYYTEKELDFVSEYFGSPPRTVNARIFRVYGCGSRDVISRWVRDSLAGNEITLYNGENVFDFVYAADVAEGLLRLAVNDSARGVVNLGSGVPHSVKEVADEIFSGLNTECKDMGTVEAVESSCADLSILKAVTGWTPPKSLKDGIRLIVEFEEDKGALDN